MTLLLRFLRKLASGLLVMVPLGAIIWAMNGFDTTERGLEFAAVTTAGGVVMYGVVALISEALLDYRPGESRAGRFVRSFSGFLLVLAVCGLFAAGLLIWLYGYEAVLAVDLSREILLGVFGATALSLWHATHRTFFPKPD